MACMVIYKLKRNLIYIFTVLFENCMAFNCSLKKSLGFFLFVNVFVYVYVVESHIGEHPVVSTLPSPCRGLRIKTLSPQTR